MARILIAEDEPHIMRVMSMWLQRNGHEVVEAKNGRLALDHLKEHEMDMLVSDVQMPQMDGFELVRQVRESLGLTIPIMVLSSGCDQAKINELLDPHGVKIYPKPFTPSRLTAEIEEMLGAVAAGRSSDNE